MKVVLDGQSSKSFTINLEGSIHGLTFLIFINNLSDGILSKIGIYADDTTLYSSLTFSLNLNWLLLWSMTFALLLGGTTWLVIFMLLKLNSIIH